MTKKLITRDLKSDLTEIFISTIGSVPPLYYLFAGKTLPYATEEIEQPLYSVKDFNSIYESMIFAKHISASDSSRMIRNIPWEPNKTYDFYRDDDPNLDSKNFFVISQEPGDVCSVFKCLHNGRTLNADGTYTIPTTFDQPFSFETSPDDEFYRTADGYVWKLMTVMDRQFFDKFVIGEFAPINANTEVQEAAIPGSISFIEVSNAGSNYNSYAYGSIKQSQVAGNPRIFSLQTDDSLDILTFGVDALSGQFVEAHTETIKKKVFFRLDTGDVWEINSLAVEGDVYATISNSIVRVLLSNIINFDVSVETIFQTNDNTVSGAVTAEGTVVSTRRDLAPNLSANTDFYKNSSFYIRSGKGAGQLKNITEYIVTGNERRILIDESFDILPDTTSRFEISPRIIIQGNGTGSGGVDTAKAIATINPSGNTISYIEMIDTGRNYTYADVIIESNTGFIDINSGLSINTSNAVLTPLISPVEGHGADIFSELCTNGVGISIDVVGDEGGKLPTVNDYRTLGIIKDIRFANAEFQIADSALLFTDGDIISQPSTGSSAEVSFRQGTTLRVRNIRGFFETGSPIFSSNEQTQSVINSIDRSFSVLDQRVKFTVEITSLGPQGTGFLQDEEVYQEISNATGIVYSTDTNRIDLTNVRGVWNVSDDSSGFVTEMIGRQSSSVAKITGKVEGDITPNSGKILYLENFAPVERAPGQTERLKIVLKF